MMKRLLLSAFLILSLCVTYAQVTTGTITGTITDSKGQTLPGASIKAVHQPTGSVYTTTASSKGTYTLPNVRVGGPYLVTVNYVGHNTATFDNLTVSLGNPLVIDGIMEIAGQTMSAVQVTGRKNGIISSQRTGASTSISLRNMQTLPTINRSVQDFARLTPQASAMVDGGDGTSRGITFAGQNNRYNQFSIDGANATDAFGLTSNGANGGQANINPISIESIQEMQVVLSPYDVTQGGFTGGGINAITKSGTNTTHGALYGVYQNQNFVGKSVLNRTKFASFKNDTWGAALGGAIIKNKLFYYVNYERYDRSTPLPYDPTVAGSGSKFNADTLANLRNYMIKTYGYDPGGFGNITKKNYSNSIFGRLDWNIDSKNKLTLRHSYVEGSNDLISRSTTSMTFANGSYRFISKANSAVAELNSTFSNSSNVLRIVYNAIRDHRETPLFPTLSIANGGVTYNIGSDNSSQVNVLNQNNFTLTDNYTMYRGKHTITIGTNNEFYNTTNLFLQNYYGNWNYGINTNALNNIQSFKQGTGLYQYSVGYSTKGGDDKAAAKMHAAQLGVYGQDVMAVTERFKLTYGLRIDLPVYFNKPPANTTFDSDPTFAAYNVKTEQMPKATPLFSPRAGFNWDVKGDATTQLRGGAGLFTGRVPFVWVSNQFSNTGVTNIAYQTATSPANPPPFHYDPKDVHAGAYLPPFNGTFPATTINVIDKKFKYPQVFRTNLAIDQKLPWWGLIGTVEAIYTKTLNNANYQNLNIPNTAPSTVNLGGETRPLWTGRITSKYTDVLELKNTSKGYSYNLTAQITKPYSRGWSGTIAYTYGHSTSLSDLTSSVAYSNWRFAYATKGLNNLDVTNSNFDLGSRIMGTISKEFRYARNHLGTTITLFYNGQSGQRISYLYSKTITGDDLSFGSNTMIYVPKTEAEANFAPLSRTVNGTNTTISADQQWADFQTFLNSNKYLKDHVGKDAPRNGDRLPFESHFDLRFAEDVVFVKSHRLQFTVDILNVSNLLNKDWGWSYNYGFSNYSGSIFTVLNTATTNPATSASLQNPKLQFDLTKMNQIKGQYKAYSVSDYTSRWNMQLGLRYSF
jgi:hypothetical protein